MHIWFSVSMRQEMIEAGACGILAISLACAIGEGAVRQGRRENIMSQGGRKWPCLSLPAIAAVEEQLGARSAEKIDYLLVIDVLVKLKA
mmetsp:Transcript_62663/g.123774  ORF Transcript_62663/g.123774 Transcript_62663/m.123774 type:complete len:89 (-) Transcript_62663:1353-1619(-)